MGADYSRRFDRNARCRPLREVQVLLIPASAGVEPLLPQPRRPSIQTSVEPLQAAQV